MSRGLVDSILDCAKSYLGISEKSSRHQEIINAYNKAKYADAYTMTINDPWCCAFVVACFGMCDAGDIIPGYAYCDGMIEIFKKWGRWQNRIGATPTKGDVVFYDWNGDGSSDHVGIVVNNSFGELNVIEGNMKDSVGYRKINSSASQIIGFGRPNYSASDGSVNSTGKVNGKMKTISKLDLEHIRTLPLLGEGSSGVYVKIIQVLLNYYHGTHLEVDGVYGPRTKTAVDAYQRAWELEVDGVVGRETWTHILIVHPDRTDR